MHYVWKRDERDFQRAISYLDENFICGLNLVKYSLGFSIEWSRFNIVHFKRCVSSKRFRILELEGVSVQCMRFRWRYCSMGWIKHTLIKSFVYNYKKIIGKWYTIIFFFYRKFLKKFLHEYTIKLLTFESTEIFLLNFNFTTIFSN